LDPVPLALALAFPDATVSRVARALALPEDQVRARVEAQVLAGDAWLLSDGRVGCQPLIGGQDATTRALRRTLSAALPHSHPGRVRLLAEAGASAHELLLVSRAVLVDPDLPPGEAIVVVERALQVARLEAAPEVEEELLRERASLSLRMEAAVPLRHALYELGRGIAAGLPLNRVETLLRGALHAVTGSLPLARELLAPLPPFSQEALEVYRVAYLASAARCEGLAEEARVLRELESWAQGAPGRGAWLQGWWGLHRYRRGEFALAAEHHERAAAGKRDRVGRLSSRANAIAALLEVDPARAAELLPPQIAEAQALRCARLELSLVCKLHSARYRIGLDCPFDAELIAQAARVREREAAQLALHQAASSWRQGQLDPARVACRAAGSLAARSGSAEIALLARALSVELGVDLDGIDSIAQAASVLEDPSIQAQVLFLLGRAGRRADLLDLAREQALQSDYGPSVRLELLSLDEILTSSPPNAGA